MKCTQCGKDCTYPQRKDSGQCPHCHRPFAFDPRKGDPFNDVLFQSAIDAVSAKGAVRFGLDHVYYEVCRRLHKKRALHLIGGVVGIVICVLALILIPWPFGLMVGGFLIAVPVTLWLIARPGSVVLMSRGDFEKYWLRWCKNHGVPKGLIVRNQAAAKSKAMEPDLGDYSFDRAVICDTEATVDLLLANQFHFENNCAVLSYGGYPPGPFALVRKMLQRNPNLQVFVLHDATPEGCRLAQKLADDPEWFKGRAKVIDVGLRPMHAKTFAGLWRAVSKDVQPGDGISAEEAKWLSVYALSLAAVRPEQVLKRLFRAINRPVPATSSSDGGTSGGVIADGGFGDEAGDTDGGADAFG